MDMDTKKGFYHYYLWLCTSSCDITDYAVLLRAKRTLERHMYCHVMASLPIYMARNST